MSDSYNRRMKRLLDGRVNDSPSDYFKRQANKLEDLTFMSDESALSGAIYDWELNLLEEVDFKFQRAKDRNPEKKAVEYYVQFRPYFVPEVRFAENYYKQDGKERLGFYLDVPNFEKNKTEKWLMVNKDPRVNFNRYMVYRCNWQLEWVSNGEYHTCLGVLRDSLDNNINVPDVSKLGGTEIDGDAAFILPSNPNTRTIIPGTRLMITDSDTLPAVYEVSAIKDTEPLGVMKFYLKRRIMNLHTDLWGDLNSMDRDLFVIPMPIEDLPDGFGGSYHYLCSCRKSSLPNTEEKPVITTKPDIQSSADFIRIGGSEWIVTATGLKEQEVAFEIYVDEVLYSKDELGDYFEITQLENQMKIKAINTVMTGYILRVGFTLNGVRYYEEAEVKM